MYPIARTKVFFVIIICIFFSLSGCSEQKNSGLFDPNQNSLPNPTITSVSPIGRAVAGIDTIIVQGTGFSKILSENSVFFNAKLAELIQSTETKITLIAPLLVSDTVIIRIAVHGSYEFSNKAQYVLKPAVAVFGDLQSTELSTALAADSAGNLYAGYSVNNLEAGILKFSPSGARSSYAPKIGGNWTSLKIGPGGYLYAARNVRAVYRFSPGGGASAAVWVALSVGISIADIDFDQSGNLWGGGNNSDIYRFGADMSVATFPFVGQIRSLRVYDGYLYFAAKTVEGEKIWRAQITAGGLGTPEVYFDFAATYPTNTPLAITFSSDGDLYIGMAENGILIVKPGKTYIAPYSVYKQLFGTGVGIITWGKVDDLYCSTVNGTLLKINVTGKKSAPYYGR